MEEWLESSGRGGGAFEDYVNEWFGQEENTAFESYITDWLSAMRRDYLDFDNYVMDWYDREDIALMDYLKSYDAFQDSDFQAYMEAYHVGEHGGDFREYVDAWIDGDGRGDAGLQAYLESFGGYEGTYQEYIMAWVEGSGKDDEDLGAYIDRWDTDVLNDLDYSISSFRYHLESYQEALLAVLAETDDPFQAYVENWFAEQKENAFQSYIANWLAHTGESSDAFRDYVAEYDLEGEVSLQEYVAKWLTGDGWDDQALRSYVSDWSEYGQHSLPHDAEAFKDSFEEYQKERKLQEYLGEDYESYEGSGFEAYVDNYRGDDYGSAEFQEYIESYVAPAVGELPPGPGYDALTAEYDAATAAYENAVAEYDAAVAKAKADAEAAKAAAQIAGDLPPDPEYDALVAKYNAATAEYNAATEVYNAAAAKAKAEAEAAKAAAETAGDLPPDPEYDALVAKYNAALSKYDAAAEVHNAAAAKAKAEAEAAKAAAETAGDLPPDPEYDALVAKYNAATAKYDAAAEVHNAAAAKAKAEAEAAKAAAETAGDLPPDPEYDALVAKYNAALSKYDAATEVHNAATAKAKDKAEAAKTAAETAGDLPPDLEYDALVAKYKAATAKYDAATEVHNAATATAKAKAEAAKTAAETAGDLPPDLEYDALVDEYNAALSKYDAATEVHNAATATAKDRAEAAKDAVENGGEVSPGPEYDALVDEYNAALAEYNAATEAYEAETDRYEDSPDAYTSDNSRAPSGPSAYEAYVASWVLTGTPDEIALTNYLSEYSGYVDDGASDLYDGAAFQNAIDAENQAEGDWENYDDSSVEEDVEKDILMDENTLISAAYLSFDSDAGFEVRGAAVAVHKFYLRQKDNLDVSEYDGIDADERVYEVWQGDLDVKESNGTDPCLDGENSNRSTQKISYIASGDINLTGNVCAQVVLLRAGKTIRDPNGIDMVRVDSNYSIDASKSLHLAVGEDLELEKMSQNVVLNTNTLEELHLESQEGSLINDLNIFHNNIHSVSLKAKVGIKTGSIEAQELTLDSQGYIRDLSGNDYFVGAYNEDLAAVVAAVEADNQADQAEREAQDTTNAGDVGEIPDKLVLDDLLRVYINELLKGDLANEGKKKVSCKSG